MSWRDRAIEANSDQPKASWRDRAVPADNSGQSDWKDTNLGFGVTPEKVIRGGLSTLPYIGGGIGGALGGGAGIAETLATGGVLAPAAVAQTGAAAAIGGAAGNSLKSFLENQIFGDKKTYSDVFLKEPAVGALKGVESELGNQVTGGLLAKAYPGAMSPGPVKYGEDYSMDQVMGTSQADKNQKILDAAKALNVKPTPGMTSDSYTVRNLEDSMSQSPSLPGYLIRRQQKPIQDAVQGQVKAALEDASSLTPYESGNEIKKGLLEQLHTEYDPIQSVFDDAKQSTKDIGINKNSIDRVSRNIGNIREANLLPGTPEAALAKQYSAGLQNAESADDLQSLLSSAKGILRDNSASYNEKQVAAQIVDKLDRLNNNTIMRGALESAPTKAQGASIGKDLVSSLKEARQAYRGLMDKTGQLADSGITSGKYGMSNIMREIDETEPQKIPQMLFRPDKIDFTRFFKENYPEQYDLAREQYISGLAKRAEGANGEVSSKKFYQAVKNLQPEIQDLLFGSEKKAGLENAKTLLQAMPPKVGASDTPRGFMFKDYFNPLEQGKAVGQYLGYKGLPLLQKAGSGVSSAIEGADQDLPGGLIGTALDQPNNVIQFPGGLLKTGLKDKKDKDKYSKDAGDFR